MPTHGLDLPRRSPLTNAQRGHLMALITRRGRFMKRLAAERAKKLNATREVNDGNQNG